MGYKDWQTPPDFYAELHKEFKFTLDAAASHENALCRTYMTSEGLFKWREGEPRASLLDKRDGLTYPWTDYRVFCNPPYDNNLYKWVAKAANREAEVSVLLLPPSIDTAWFHDFLAPISLRYRYNSHGIKSDVLFTSWSGYSDFKTEVLFYKGRLRFWRDGKLGPSPRAGNMLAVFWR